MVFLSLQLFVCWQSFSLFEDFDSSSLTYGLCLQVYEEHLTHPEVVGEPQAGVDGSVAIISLPLQYPFGEPLECGKRGVCLYDGCRLRPLEDDALLLLFG